MHANAEPSRAPQLELILQQVESLPTLPAVAMRLLSITTDDRSEARQVIELVRADPALTAKVLAMCRAADRAVAEPITTVDRAVLMLGFDAIRNAVLSIKVLQAFSEEGGENNGKTDENGAIRFSRAAFWRHSLAVAIASELIASRHKNLQGVRPADAFVCGLLHDLGKLALEFLLPRSYQRVVELTEQHQMNIADVERRVIGLDHQTVGKRLAEHWRLPHVIQDTMWLHGTPAAMLPELPHSAMIGLVGVADLLVRQQHLGYSGNFDVSESLNKRAAEAGLDPRKVGEVVTELHEELERRAEAMGLGQSPSRALFLESIMQANQVLGRLNTNLEQQRRASTGQSRILESITRFHQNSGRPGRTAADVAAAIAESAIGALGDGQFAVLYEPASGQACVLARFDRNARLVQSSLIEGDAPALGDLQDDAALAGAMSELLPRLTPLLPESAAPHRHLRLPCGWGTVGVLLHNLDRLPAGATLEALRHTWGAAIAAAVQHNGARRLGEQLVELNRELAEAQQSLLRNASMARLGEMAAGAAHEMNNPLAVISGRAQLLAMKLGADSSERKAAEQIVQQSQKLSDLITALRLFAEPPTPQITAASLPAVLEEAVRLTRVRQPDAEPLIVAGVEDAPMLHTDPSQLAAVLAEVLLNAHQSQPRSAVRVQTSVDPVNDRFILQVTDDGVGMDAATLEHAFDPFFSVKPAGRQSGLGLARAQRLIDGLGGQLNLTSQPGKGTTATIGLPLAQPNKAPLKFENPQLKIAN